MYICMRLNFDLFFMDFVSQPYSVCNSSKMRACITSFCDSFIQHILMYRPKTASNQASSACALRVSTRSGLLSLKQRFRSLQMFLQNSLQGEEFQLLCADDNRIFVFFFNIRLYAGTTVYIKCYTRIFLHFCSQNIFFSFKLTQTQCYSKFQSSLWCPEFC